MPRRSSRYRARPKSRAIVTRTPASVSTSEREPEPEIDLNREVIDWFPQGRTSEGDEPDPPLPCIILEQLKNECCFLFNRGMGDAEMELLAEVFKDNTTVSELNLGSNAIGDAGILALFYPLRTDALVKVLHLHKNRIGDAGAGILAEAMKTNTTVRELYLGSNQVGDIGTEAFAQALKSNSTLKKLSLAKNAIGDAGAEAVIEALKLNTGLSELALDFNLITEKSVAALKALHSLNKTLDKVTLVGNRIEETEEEEAPQMVTATSSKEVNEGEYAIHIGGCISSMIERLGPPRLPLKIREIVKSFLPHSMLEKLGIGLQVVNGDLVLDAIGNGLVESWNKMSPPETLAEAGDCILAVNGLRGSAQELIAECEEEQDLTIVLKRRRMFALTVAPGHHIFIDGFKDRPEVNGKRGIAVNWFDPVKRWKVKLEDGSVMMCKAEELKIDRSQVLAGGYGVGEFILSRVGQAFKSGATLREGDVGMVVAPSGELSAVARELGLIVAFSTGKVIMLATNVKPKDALLGPAEFQISLEGERKGLGASVEVPCDGCSLLIKSISPGGLIEDWNQRCDPDTLVQEGGRIVEVNGFRGSARQLVEACKLSPVKTLVIMR